MRTLLVGHLAIISAEVHGIPTFARRNMTDMVTSKQTKRTYLNISAFCPGEPDLQLKQLITLQQNPLKANGIKCSTQYSERAWSAATHRRSTFGYSVSLPRGVYSAGATCRENGRYSVGTVYGIHCNSNHKFLVSRWSVGLMSVSIVKLYIRSYQADGHPVVHRQLFINLKSTMSCNFTWTASSTARLATKHTVIARTPGVAYVRPNRMSANELPRYSSS